MLWLTRRADFVAAAKGRRAHRPAFTLQALRRPGEAAGEPRFGLTATRKIGGAVERNRIKRRLREALRGLHRAKAGIGRAGHDYVLVLRREALDAPFAELERQLGEAFTRVHSARPPQASASRRERRDDDAHSRRERREDDAQAPGAPGDDA